MHPSRAAGVRLWLGQTPTPAVASVPRTARVSRRIDQPMGTKSRAWFLLSGAGVIGSPGSPAGCCLRWGWERVRAWAGARARLLPYVACKRVGSRQPSSGLCWRRAGLPMVYRGM